MRTVKLLFLIVACCGVAAAQGQATVMGGYASNWVSPAVAVPFVPLVNTPEMSLGQPALTIGASNATLGLTAGATASTLAMRQEES